MAISTKALAIGLIIGLVIGGATSLFVKPKEIERVTETVLGPTVTEREMVTETISGPTETVTKTILGPTVTVTKTVTPTPTPTPTPSVGYSRQNPAPIGTSLDIEFEYFLETYKARITLLEVIRGEEAWELIKEANIFNDPPEEGFEYILAKVRFEYLEGPDPDTKYDLSPLHFTAVSEDGKDYERPLVVDPEPSIGVGLYPGASHEGWVSFHVAIDDSKPTMTFGRDYKGRGGVWFKLYVD